MSKLRTLTPSPLPQGERDIMTTCLLGVISCLSTNLLNRS